MSFADIAEIAAAVVLFGVFVAPILFVVIWGIVGVAVQASQRGQGFLSWFLLQLVSFNPMYPMILVAMLPNEKRNRLRQEFRDELDDKLAALASGRPPDFDPETEVRIDLSLGDAVTEDGVLQRSLGDMPTTGPTAGPIERSIGDMPTRE